MRRARRLWPLKHGKSTVGQVRVYTSPSFSKNRDSEFHPDHEALQPIQYLKPASGAVLRVFWRRYPFLPSWLDRPMTCRAVSCRAELLLTGQNALITLFPVERGNLTLAESAIEPISAEDSVPST